MLVGVGAAVGAGPKPRPNVKASKTEGVLDLAPGGDKVCGRATIGAISFQTDRNIGDDASGASTHHKDSIGEVDCFLHIMGDHHPGGG